MAIDETALKTAIRGLTDRLTIKPEHWQIFFESFALIKDCCADADSERDYWRKLFDGQGATNALNKNFYTEETVRLLTLRAIALPETLPDLLKWLKIGTPKSEYDNISLEFQEQVLNLINEGDLKEQVMAGSRSLIEGVFTENITVKAVTIFLNDVRGIWAKYRIEYLKDLKNDLEILGEQQATYKKQGQSQTTFNYSFSKGMQRYWQPYKVKPNSDYYVLAELFFELKDYQLAACFHQLSYGYVTNDLFSKAFPQYYGLISFHGLRIRQEGYNSRGEKIIVPRLYVAIIAVTMLLLGVLGGVVGTNILQDSASKIQTLKAKNETLNSEKQTFGKAVNNFPETQTSLTAIFKELKKKCTNKDDQNIQTEIKEIFKSSYLKFDDKDKSKALEIGNWVKAILQYQQTNKFLTPDGIITKNAHTYNKLVQDAKEKLICP